MTAARIYVCNWTLMPVMDTPAMIRFGQLTNDEFFVTENAAKQGVRVTNLSKTEPLVMLRHFGPGNPDLPAL